MSKMATPIVVTKEMAEAERKIHGFVKVFSLEDGDGNSIGDAMFKRPSARVLSEWEKWLEKDPMKSRRILVNGTLLNRIEEVKEWESASDEFYAVYNAATGVIPAGKATLKNI
jgi:hypothetical protein